MANMAFITALCPGLTQAAPGLRLIFIFHAQNAALLIYLIQDASGEFAIGTLTAAHGIALDALE